MSASHNETMLAKIKSVLEGRIDADIENYKIAGREIAKIPIKDLVELKDHYQAKVNKEKNAAAVRAGQGNSNTIKVKFV